MENFLENEFVKAVFSDRAELLELINRQTGTSFIQPHGLWRMIVREKDNLEVEVLPESAIPEMEVSGNELSIRYSELATESKHPLKIELEIHGCLHGNVIDWNLRIANHTKDIQIREMMFPILHLSSAMENMPLYHSRLGGEVISSIREKILSSTMSYKGMDELYRRYCSRYPFPLATNCLTFNSGSEGIYLGSHDDSFQDTLHVFELEKKNHLNALLVKYPFLSPGESTEIRGYAISLYQGPWQRAADQYRAWAETWFHHEPPPEHVRRMRGWQRIIARTQYGENLYPYRTFPGILEDGKKAGIDTLFLFGWHRGGHDCDYPNYIPSPELGGTENLRENIASFRKNGGHVILYSNGQLIDKNTEFYRKTGHRISTKDLNGNEQQQFYGFSGRGTAQNLYGNRTFVTACPACQEWLDVLKQIADTAAELGCDGVFYDQLGACSNICCDPSHGHRVPFTDSTRARSEMIRELRKYVKKRYPAMSFGIELISDLSARYADYVHNLIGGTSPLNPDWEQKQEKPQIAVNVEWFRYTFPEIILSDREIRDDTDIERRVNRVLLNNLISDVEIYRCKKTIAETPHYQEYLGKANRFRSRFAHLLDGAVFRSTLLHRLDNPEIDSSGYLAPDGATVVIATQSHKPELSARIEVPGKKQTEQGFLGDGTISADGTLILKKHALAILVFR